MNSPNEPEAMEDSSHTCTWTQSKLGDVAHYVNDKIIGREISIEQYVSTENMLVDKGGIVKAAIVPEESKITKYCAGDILISNIRPYFKKIWLAKHDGGCSTDVLVIRTKKGMDANFLYYSLTQDKFFDYVVAGSKGTKMPRGDKNAILEFSVPKPHLQEQEEIGKILSALDSKIELNQQMNKTLESIAQALFKHWFIDFEFPDENGQPYKSSGGEMVDTDMGPIPKMWKICKLNTLASMVRGVSYRSADLQESENAMVTLKSINRGGGFNKNGYKPYTGKFKPNQVVLPGEIVLAHTDVTQNAEVIGKPAVVESKSCFKRLIASMDLGIIRSKSSFDMKYFIYYLLKSDKFQAYINGYVNGTTVLHLDSSAVLEFEFPEPNDELKHKFQNIGDYLIQRILINSAENEALEQIRDLLLPRLLSGKLRVPLEDTNV